MIEGHCVRAYSSTLTFGTNELLWREEGNGSDRTIVTDVNINWICVRTYIKPSSRYPCLGICARIKRTRYQYGCERHVESRVTFPAVHTGEATSTATRCNRNTMPIVLQNMGYGQISACGIKHDLFSPRYIWLEMQPSSAFSEPYESVRTFLWSFAFLLTWRCRRRSVLHPLVERVLLRGCCCLGTPIAWREFNHPVCVFTATGAATNAHPG